MAAPICFQHFSGFNQNFNCFALRNERRMADTSKPATRNRGNPAAAIGKAADLQVAPVCPVQEDYRKQPASQLASHPAS